MQFVKDVACLIRATVCNFMENRLGDAVYSAHPLVSAFCMLKDFFFFATASGILSLNKITDRICYFQPAMQMVMLCHSSAYLYT